MRYCIPLLCCMAIAVSCNTAPSSPSASIPYKKSDLKKINWIEGNWKGLDGDNPFYELYSFKNDSTIEIISYEWNGADSSHSSKSLLAWNDDQYYLGDALNYNVIEITDSTISMNPNYKANNSILWKKKDSTTWLAILKSKTIEKVYTMERVDHFDK